MKRLLSWQKFAPYILLAMLILFNFFLYKNEFKVLSDPNDNNFHFALIAEAKNVWKDIFHGKLSPFYLLNSWNERWAEGFPVSLYYSHFPEAVISLSSFLVPISTFNFFVIIRTSLLILLPISFFFGAQLLGFSSGLGLIFAFFSQAIFTDGLYGIDQSSFLWRGWGLFSQLLALFILPFAFGYTINYLKNKKNLGRAILFNFFLAEAHFGIFYLLLFAYPLFWLFNLNDWRKVGKRTIIFLFFTLLALSYFIIPFFTTGQYRNFSFWDPIWKFDSWGWKQVLTWLLNGNLFDFKRFPFLTITVLGGVFWGLISKNRFNRYLVALCGLYFALFIGRDILGPLINIIPGLSEFHLHRTIVMFQFISLLIASNGLNGIIEALTKSRLLSSFVLILVIILSCLCVYFIEKPIINYVADNDRWLAISNYNYQQDSGDYQAVISRLESLPSARIYAGRPGNWGKNFKIGETQLYMALSRDGFPTVGFLPESWSPNSDPEQFFSEDDQNFYNLYNVGYLLMPKDHQPPVFAKLILSQGKFSLYKINTDGWFSLGKTSLGVVSKKTDLLNITHLWLNSKMFLNKDYPVIALNNEKLTFVERVIKMSGPNNYNGDQSIWLANPLSVPQEKFEAQISNKVEKKIPQGYSVSFRLKKQCDNCILVLKQTFHPNWKVTINGKKQNAYPVFPFFIGIRIKEPGDYKIVASYK